MLKYIAITINCERLVVGRDQKCLYIKQLSQFCKELMKYKDNIVITKLALKFNGLKRVQIADQRNDLLNNLIKITTTTTIKTIAIKPYRLTGSSSFKILDFWYSKPNGRYQYLPMAKNDYDLKLYNMTAFGH